MIEVNLEADWRLFVKQQLSLIGVSWKSEMSNSDLTLLYFDQKRRRLHPRPRVVHTSRELIIPPEHTCDYTDLKQLIEAGGDLTDFLSHKLKRLRPYDGTLYAWNLHHLHFRRKGNPDTSHLLFVRFTADEAFVIQTMTHGNPWVNTWLLEIIVKNWPLLIEPGRLNGVHGENLQTEQLAAIRRKNANVAVTLSDGTVYQPSGITPSGHCIFDVMLTDRTLQDLKCWSETIRKNESDIRASARLSIDEPFELKLLVGETCWSFYAPARKIHFHLNVTK